MARIPDIFQQLMRAPGAGIPAFSAGLGIAVPLQRELYRRATGDESLAKADGRALEERWKESWSWLKGDGSGQVAVIGVPLDTGAGIRRGAASGPRAVREAWIRIDGATGLLKSHQVVDLGDVFVNPHLLHDEMLSEAQIGACRAAMYPDASADLRSRLAVSALSQLKQILSELKRLHPKLKVFVIGGDHSCAWPVSEVMAAAFPGTLSIVQPDAHTDLLPIRLGVKYCFGTWSFHANNLIGRGGRLVQLGVRQSGKDKAHWESQFGVRQFWANELNPLSDENAVDRVLAHLRAVGIRQIYFSNDVDGTDEGEISATGTPAPEGLRSSFLMKLLPRLASEFELVAADIMEVAPDLGEDAEVRARTLELSAKYMQASLEALLVR